ncbi:MAG: glycoside hydrolase family 127 protein [Candidatus Thermoplasmatota archaeon]|nr:glycoside hydrolase family 127 protein [Candidatus Thermoplasmatota archaeon]
MSKRILALAFSLCTIFVLFSGCIGGRESSGNDEGKFLYDNNLAPLQENSYVKLPIGTITANGWLANQLQLQADGITGNLENLHMDVGPDSDWLGGSVDSWESAPYYVRGLTDLAYQTGNKTLIERALKWINWTINSQREDGLFGPVSTDSSRSADLYWWPRMPMLHALRIYYDATGDERVIPFMTKFFKYELASLPNDPNGLGTWGGMRGAENIASVYWLYSKTGESWLLDLGQMISEKTYDWTTLFETDSPIIAVNPAPQDQTHTVNIAMAYKLPALYWLQSHDKRYFDAAYAGVEHIAKYHGQIEGTHAGDERVELTRGTAGSETCQVVEEMYSMETILGITGDPMFADRLERLAFNALPATLKPDMTGHQYFQQPNQVDCGYMSGTFSMPYPDALQFGTAPAYKCCAFNMHYGWPSLCEHLWMASSDGALAAIVYGPCEVNAAADDGTKVNIVEETDYPFRGSVKLTVNPERAVEFPIQLRIPQWCAGASYSILDASGSVVESASNLKNSTFIAIERKWKQGDTILLNLPREINISRWEKDSVGVQYGPLVFSIAINEDWILDRDTPTYPIAEQQHTLLFPGVNYSDERFGPWQVHSASDWNYGVVASEDDIASAFEVVDLGKEVGLQPWMPDNTPIIVKMDGRKIPTWVESPLQSADPLPQSPVMSIEPDEQVILKPYGSVRLRISYIPLIGGALPILGS